MAPGGLVKQCILEDKSPASVWDREQTICFNVQILNSALFREVTGMTPLATPISAATYAAYGLPFFKIYNEISTIKGEFQGVKSINEIEHAKAHDSKGDPKKGQDGTTYLEPPYKNPIILLNPDGIQKKFRPVSELEKELLSMNAVQF